MDNEKLKKISKLIDNNKINEAQIELSKLDQEYYKNPDHYGYETHDLIHIKGKYKNGKPIGEWIHYGYDSITLWFQEKTNNFCCQHYFLPLENPRSLLSFLTFFLLNFSKKCFIFLFFTKLT